MHALAGTTRRPGFSPPPRSRDSRFLVYAALGLAVFVEPARAQVTPTFDDVTYAVAPRDDGGTVTLHMDIYRPAGPGPFPCIVWVHGGGWTGGTFQTPPPSTAALLQRGIAAASVQYRFSQEAIFPAQINDVKGAVRFLRANAGTFGLDVTRFGTWGSSAGGHLAALLATSGDVPALEGVTGGNLGWSSRVQVAADYFGPTDILNMNPDVTTPPGSTLDHDAPGSPESRLVGWDGPGQGIGNIRANLANPNPPYPALVMTCFQVNPVTWVTPDDPPMFLGHGTIDTLVPLNQSTRLSNALTAAGVAHEYRQVPGAGHGSLGLDTNTATLDLFSARLVNHVPLAGDHNGDADVDAFDFAAFDGCLTRPDVGMTNPICPAFDLDLDDDVDFADFRGLQLSFTGPSE